ncbi:hypothetical protein [Thermus sp.]|uniref:hypothetical protein n=1 Tax=Thermus sp. TaxID=275 RepID=UPI0025CDCC14|nr:hypothetical protein [Thermus sp.]MCS6869465.1 hypothetical protein [Thermus sp.]
MASVETAHNALEKHQLTLHWQGPYAWPGYEAPSGLPALPPVPGVYLQTFEYQGGYLIYLVGLSRRPLPVRFQEHRRCYRAGRYNVLEVAAIQQGQRREVWHGWGYARAHPEEFKARKEAVEAQLAAFLRGPAGPSPASNGAPRGGPDGAPLQPAGPVLHPARPGDVPGPPAGRRSAR